MIVETLEDRIIRHEGYKSMPYKDTLGNWTIGIGHCLSASECDNYHNGLSYDDAVKLLEDDLARDKENAAKEFGWLLGLDECRYGIIIEMCFQLGVGGVAQFKNMIAAIRDKDWPRARQEMLDSQWYKQTPARCEELAELMLNGGESNA